MPQTSLVSLSDGGLTWHSRSAAPSFRGAGAAGRALRRGAWPGRGGCRGRKKPLGPGPSPPTILRALNSAWRDRVTRTGRVGPELQAAVHGCAGCAPPGSHSGSAAPPEPSPREVTAGRTLPHLQLPAASCERSHSASEGGSRAPRPRPGSCQPGGWQGERVECQHCSVSSHIRGVRQLSPRRQGHARRPSCPVRRGRPALRYAGAGARAAEGTPAAVPSPLRVRGCHAPAQGASRLRAPLPSAPPLSPAPLGGAA